MARDMDSIILVVEALFSEAMRALDHSIPPVPFDKTVRL